MNKCSQCGLVNSEESLHCERCNAPLPFQSREQPPRPVEPVSLQGVQPYAPPAQRDPYQCWRCGGRYVAVYDQPNKGTGCIVVLLGFLLAPACIGIFIIIYGFSMMSDSKGQWQCGSCGLTLPMQ